MTKNIVQATVRIQGIRPLLWHRFGPESLPLEKQERTGVAGNDPEEWKRTVTVIGDKCQLCIDGTYVFACVREGAKFIRKSRMTLQSPVSATLQVQETLILIDDRYLPFGFSTPPPTDATQPVYLDIRGVRNPTTKAHNVRYRVACSPGWKCSFTLRWDKSVVSRPEMESILLQAGALVGIGNGRSIGFGRFDIEQLAMAEQ